MKTLPNPILSVTVPYYFSPSKLLQLKECPFSALAAYDTGDKLRSNPFAIFGTALHHIKQQLEDLNWGSCTTSMEALSYIYKKTLAEQNVLMGTQQYEAYLPYYKKTRRLHSLVEIAASLKEKQSSRAEAKPLKPI